MNRRFRASNRAISRTQTAWDLPLNSAYSSSASAKLVKQPGYKECLAMTSLSAELACHGRPMASWDPEDSKEDIYLLTPWYVSEPHGAIPGNDFDDATSGPTPSASCAVTRASCSSSNRAATLPRARHRSPGRAALLPPC